MNKPKLTISVLISRNYEGVKRCLDSLCPILEQVPSELILTDTGCGKRVRELIEGYTDHIIDFEWIKDFSAARNVGLKEASGEWFMYIDDDEWFDDVKELVGFFNSGECDIYNVATYIQRNYLEMDGSRYGDHNVDRILRNTPTLHFERRIHEAYTGIDIGKKKKLRTFVHHYGYAYKNEEEKLEKSKRNRELLIIECEDHPEDMRMRHQLVIDYNGTKEYDDAIKEALKGIKVKSDSQYWDALHTDLLESCNSKKDWNAIIEYGEKFLNDRLFPYDEFGVRQYLICAYWSTKNYNKVCDISQKAINTYIDYKKNPSKYDRNQLMRDVFWQEEKVCKMLLFIIDSAIEVKNNEIIEILTSHSIREELLKLASNETYRTWLIQMLDSTIEAKSQLELFNKLIIAEDITSFLTSAVALDIPHIEFESLEFDPKFFEPETRDGFYIEPLIKNAWAAQLQTLYMFDKICEENNLIYAVDWGTLLGAIRHNGFVPWDDDLDVCMPREDLMKFYKIIPYYPELECLNPYNTPDLGIHASRLNLSRDFTVDRDKLKDYKGFPFPVGIDIFTVDYVPRDKEKEDEQIMLMEKVNYAANLTILIEEHDEKEEEYYKAYKKYIKDIKELTNIEFSVDEPTLYELTVLYDEIQSAYSDEDSDYVSELACIMTGKDYYLSKDTYNNLIRVQLENLMVPVPRNYDEVLKAKYGEDYMVPNNVEGGHDYPFYNESIKETMDSMGTSSFDETKKNIEKISSGYYRRFLNRRLTPTLELSDEDINNNPNGRIQAALLEVLEEVIRLCKSNNIKYYYIDGTNEEIDSIRNMSCDSTDIHIGMLRTDYMRFQQILQEELDPWFDFRSIYTHRDHSDMRTYVITDAYATKKGEYEKRFHGCKDIVGVDIAPIDRVNDDDSVEELKRTIITKLLEGAYNMPENPPYSEEIISVITEWEDLLKININREGNLRNEMVKAADGVAMSDDDDRFNRVRISSDIADDNYRLYDKSYFEV